MASLTERLEADYKAALKAGERLRVDTIRLIKAGLQRVAIEKHLDRLEDRDVVQVISQQAKQRRETLDAAKQSGRQDVLQQTSKELEILQAYLPQQLSEAALSALIDEAIGAGDSSQGAIMKYVMGKASGAADGKLVSQLVAARLKR